MSSTIPVGLDVSTLYCRVAIHGRGVVSNTQGARFTLGLVAREEGEEGEDSTSFVFGDAAQRASHSLTLSQAIAEGGDAEAAQAFFQYMIQLAADNAAVSVDLLRLVVTLPTTSATDETAAWLDCITAACKKLIPDKKKRKQNFIMGVINKPAATCLAYNNDNNEAEKKNILVVDMDGDASLQWTVLEYTTGGVYSKKQQPSGHSGSLPDVSGPVVVQLLANFVATQFERQCKIPRGEVMERKKAKTKLMKEAEKQLLSDSGKMSFLMDGLYDGMDCNVNVSKPRWDMMTGKLLRQVEAALEPLTTTDDDAVDAVLVSGAWAASLCMTTLTKLFGQEKLITAASLLPEEAVVLGCAKQAGYCAAKSNELQPITSPTVSVPVSPISIGLSDDIILIPQGAPLPAKTMVKEAGKLYQLTPTKIELAELEGDTGALWIELSTEGTLCIGRLGEEAPLVTI